MKSIEDYWRLAAEYLRQSRVMADPQSKAMLVQMAATWIRLAERLEGKADKQAA